MTTHRPFFRALSSTVGAAGGTAYAHCNGGRGRAPTISTAYLFWLGGMSLADAAATMTAGRKSQPKVCRCLEGRA